MFAGTLSGPALDALAILGKSDILKSSYLAGGSALALQLGHRKSYDFDFFTPQALLAKDLAAQLAAIGKFSVTLLEPPHTLLGVFNEIKFSMFRYGYPLINPLKPFQNVELASVADIAAMKLTAISGRATKRDYVDLFVIAKRHPVDHILRWYEKKFGDLGNNLSVIIKALGYFEDAETDEMPQMLTPVSWDEVKAFFIAESLRLAKQHLEPASPA
jgi:hypothetical protein